MKTRNRLLSVLFLVAALGAHAFPIALPGSEGFKVFANSVDDIVATYEGNSAAYSNDLYLEGFGFVFNNHTSAVGSTVNLGSFSIGTELVFRLRVNDTGYDFFSGPGALNPDGHAHARVQSNWGPNTTLVSFEDLYDGPFDYNDLSFSFTNTLGSEEPIPSTVPEQIPTSSALLFALAGLAFVARLRR